MDRSDAASLAFKLAGIYVMVEAIKLVPTVAIPLRAFIQTDGVKLADVAGVGVPLLISCTALAILSYLLIAKSRRFADRSLAAPEQSQIDFQRRIDELQVVAFSVVGVLLLCQGIPELVRIAAGGYHNRELMGAYLRENAPDLIVLFIQLTAGYWLFFGPRSATRAWSRLSGAGMRMEAPPGAPPVP